MGDALTPPSNEFVSLDGDVGVGHRFTEGEALLRLGPGRWQRDGLRITYDLAGRRYRQDLTYGLVVGTPEGLVDGQCPEEVPAATTQAPVRRGTASPVRSLALHR